MCNSHSVRKSNTERKEIILGYCRGSILVKSCMKVKMAAHSVGGGAEEFHQDVLVGSRSLHGLPELLHGVDDGRIQHGQDGVLEVP